MSKSLFSIMEKQTGFYIFVFQTLTSYSCVFFLFSISYSSIPNIPLNSFVPYTVKNRGTTIQENLKGKGLPAKLSDDYMYNKTSINNVLSLRRGTIINILWRYKWCIFTYKRKNLIYSLGNLSKLISSCTIKQHWCEKKCGSSMPLHSCTQNNVKKPTP